MNHSEWCKIALQNGSTEISTGVSLLLSHIGSLEEEALWTHLALSAACLSDLARGGHIHSLPAKLDVQAVEVTFMRLLNVVQEWQNQSNESGSESSALPEFVDTIIEEEQ